MKKRFTRPVGLLAAGLFLASSSYAFAADVAGVVVDQQGHGVGGIHIVAQNEGNKASAQALTDARGAYRINGLEPSTYNFSLDPGKNGFKPGTAVSYVDAKGVTVNWRVSPQVEAVAAAKEGVENSLLAADPFGMSVGEFASVLVLSAGVVAGGVVGGYGAAGGFSGHGNNGVSSPSL